MSQKRPLRTRNPDAKRALIVAAAETLLARDGFERTKMSDIATEAGVAVGTVYRLFPDKPSLLADLQSSIEDEFISAMQDGWHSGATASEKFEGLVEALMLKLVSLKSKMPLYMMTRHVIGATKHQPGIRVIATIADLYSELVESGEARSFPPDYQACLGHAIIEGAFRAWMMEPSSARLSTVTRETQALVKRAFLI